MKQVASREAPYQTSDQDSSSREAEVASRKAFERQHSGSREAAESWPDIRPPEVFSRLLNPRVTN